MFFIRQKMIYAIFVFSFFFTTILAQPQSHRSDIEIKDIGTLSRNTLRIKLDPTSNTLYVLEDDGDINKVTINSNGTAEFTTVYTSEDHGLEDPLGMAFGPDGVLYIVGNTSIDTDPPSGTAIIVKGEPLSQGSDERNFSILAETVEYNYGQGYNHRMSGIAVDPNNDFIYVNSGARTDHGEIREGGIRETGLTSLILKLPTDGENIILQDDREWLRENGYLMAEGTRNVFDLAFNSNGELFSVENSGDRDDPEEMNWIREGHHYGFPWFIGGNRTPQQDTPYVPQEDPLLSPDAWGGGPGLLYTTFSNDPTYPSPPDSITFTNPIPSIGPDADKFRDTITGEVKDASNLGEFIYTFTAHRSPNGIVFDKDSLLISELAGGAFVLSFNSNEFENEGEQGRDLLHVALTKNDEGEYTAEVNLLVSNFTQPLGIDMFQNKVYVAETRVWGGVNPKLWEITLPEKSTVSVKENITKPASYILYQNHPNPFNPETKIQFYISKDELVSLNIYDVLGNKISTLVNERKEAGIHTVNFNGANLNSGVYFYTLTAGNFTETKKLILIK